MVIRDFIPADEQAYLAYSDVFYNTGAVLHSVPASHFVTTFHEGCKGNPLMRGLMIVDEDEQIAGYALLSFTWSNEAGGKAVMLEEFYVDPAHRGAKLGTRFLQWLLEEYKDAKRIRLEVSRENESAIRLYERTGFEHLDYMQMVLDQK